MDQFKEKLKRIHFTWYGLAGLWLASFIAVCASINSNTPLEYDPTLGYATRSHTAEGFAITLVFAYLIGGFILGKIHNKHTSNFVNASYDIEKKGDAMTFKVTAAKRHMGFWVVGLFGLFFMFSLGYMFAGNGAGTFFTILLGGVFYLLCMQPKLWKQIGEQSFELSPSQLSLDGQSYSLSSDLKGFFIGNFLPSKAEKGMDQNTYIQHTQQTYFYGTPGQVMAAQGLAAAQQIGVGATQAGGAAIAEIANRYFYEMKARSFQIEAVRGGKNLIVCKGLDANTAQAMMAEIEKIAQRSSLMAA